jgi:hypothetical protein
MTISNITNMTEKGEHSSAHFVHGKEVKFQNRIKFSEGTDGFNLCFYKKKLLGSHSECSVCHKVVTLVLRCE